MIRRIQVKAKYVFLRGTGGIFILFILENSCLKHSNRFVVALTVSEI